MIKNVLVCYHLVWPSLLGRGRGGGGGVAVRDGKVKNGDRDWDWEEVLEDM